MKKLLGEEVFEIIRKHVSILRINEIRVRLNQRIFVKSVEDHFEINFVASKSYIENIINIATNNSRYAYEKQISDGYIEYENGIRIGLTGSGTVNSKQLIVYQCINALCIRIPRVIENRSDLDKYIKNFSNTLIISPPYCGKTTLIRYFANLLACENDVVIIDERYEIAGKNLVLLDKSAKRADVVQGIEKGIIFERIIRSMSPQIVIFDEIFSESDMIAVHNFQKSGILCLASCHGKDLTDVNEKLKRMFDTFIILSSKPTVGSIVSIIKKYD